MGKKLGYFLIAVILGIEIPRFFGAYSGIDPDLLGLPLTALATGIVLPVGSMYIFHTWWEQAWNKSRKNVLLLWFAANLVLSGLILIPWGMAQLQTETLSVVVSGWWAWLWVGCVMVSPFVLMGGITTAMAFQKQEKRKPEPKREVERPEPIMEPVSILEPEPDLDETAVGILETWAEQPEWSLHRVGEAVGTSKSTVHRYEKELAQMGLLSRTSQGVKVSWNGNGEEP